MPEVNRPDPGKVLRLDQQLCFPLYAASRLVTRLYHDKLAPLGITYPQYVALMILWEEAPCSVSRLGERAMLNSNTLTPLLKRLEQQGLISRQRDATDERQVNINLTAAGRALENQCQCIPGELISRIGGQEAEEFAQLKVLLDKLLPKLRDAL